MNNNILPFAEREAAQDIAAVREGLQTMIKSQASAFKAGDLEGFMSWFDLDLVSDYYMRRWFTGYAIKTERPQDCRGELVEVRAISAEKLSCTISFQLHYANFESEIATFQSRLSLAQENSHLRLSESAVSLAQPAWPDPPASSSLPLSYLSPSQEPDPLRAEWWQRNELTDIARTSADYLKASLYARAIPKSTRYRSTHPEIDSAAILSDMMSWRAIRLAFSWGTDDPATFVRQINRYGQQTMVGKTYDDLRRENKSYFPARELSLEILYSLDESIAFGQKRAPAEVGCPEIAAFYVAMLRLQGLDPWHAFILIQPFHYLTFFQLAQGTYILSVHDVMPMGPRRLYGDTEVTRFVSPAFFLDQTGQTNMPAPLEEQLRQLIEANLPIFSLPQSTRESDCLPETAEPRLSIHTHPTPAHLAQALKQHVFEMSRKYPASPFTWAKYIHQTLLVPQPQAYLIWSLRAPECQAFVQQQPNLEAVRQWMGQYLGKKSIFREPDRVMTADQVLRHCRGSAKDRAVLLYTAVNLLGLPAEGGIVLTSTGAYVVLAGGHQQVIYDAESLQEVKRIEGKVVLAFNEKMSFDPFRVDQDTAPAAWLAPFL